MKISKITVTTEWVDEETGEITKDVRELKEDSIKKPRASRASSKKVEENPNPILTLEDNKYILTTGAIQLLGVLPGDKIDIKFQKVNDTMVPVIGTSKAFGTKSGNKITKSNSVSYRGKNNEELSAFGSEFTLEQHPSAVGLFVLKGDGDGMDIEEEAKPEEEDLEVEDIDALDDVQDNEEQTDDLDFTL